MGVADSPLRDRVVFVEGAPRSGTTWLTAILATHPQIAGITSESHLFDLGVDRLFDNHESTASWHQHLGHYVSREQLVDLVRGLCDGVLMEILRQVKPDAQYVVEKTPLATRDPNRQVERKLECYPDARYVHIVRDGAAVARSLAAAPWARALPRRAQLRRWRRAIGLLRETLGDLPTYREVRYEDLVADPGRVAAGLFEWLGLEHGEEVLDRVRAVSVGERHSSLPPPPAGPVTRVRGFAKGLLAGGGGEPDAPAASDPVEALLGALQTKGTGDLCPLTSPDFSLEVRTGEGDAVAEGEAAHALLDRVADALFGQRFVTHRWDAARSEPTSVFLFSGIRPDAGRVDVAFAATVRDGRVAALSITSAGALGGRPARDLEM